MIGATVCRSIGEKSGLHHHLPLFTDHHFFYNLQGMSQKIPDKSLLRQLPKVDTVLAHGAITALYGTVPELIVKQAVRDELEHLRERILSGEIAGREGLSLDVVARAACDRALGEDRPRFRHVINATGIVVHTNLGRSPLSEEAIGQVALAARGYSNLEYDLETGKRGSRDDLVEETLCRITGAEAATVVNNNAAAVMLVLRTLASDRDVVVSRGELVEIGGSFRIPDVMEASGARLIEVGTTNRTRIADYRKGMKDSAALLLKVHTSNYRIVGFTEEVPVSELAALGKEKGVPVVVDLGSGSIIDTRQLGLRYHEPAVSEVLREGADVVTFSGDKLLGGPQAGIIIGRNVYMGEIKRNPMKRALRVGKLTLAALESVLKSYLDPETSISRIPTLRMIAASRDSVAARARRFARRISDLPLRISFVPDVSRVGGGALPMEDLPTVLLAIQPEKMSAGNLEQALRVQDPPVIARIVDNKLCFDLRTVSSRELGDLEKAIKGAILDAETRRHADTEKDS
jgi:L-seryl-tRNA(Ser) seleniumtransferase